MERQRMNHVAPMAERRELIDEEGGKSENGRLPNL
jgi:hypothetical protein